MVTANYDLAGLVMQKDQRRSLTSGPKTPVCELLRAVNPNAQNNQFVSVGLT